MKNMIITTNVIRFFSEHIFSSCPQDNFFEFKEDFYWSNWHEDLFDQNNEFYTPGYRSLFDDILELKRMKSIRHFMTWLTLDRFCSVLLEVGNMHVNPPSPNRKTEFIFSKSELLRIMNIILDKIDFTENTSVEIINTACWTTDPANLFLLDDRPTFIWQDHTEKLNLLISIYEGKTSLDKFNINDFYWCFKIFCYNLNYNSPNSGFWICQNNSTVDGLDPD